MEELIKNLFGDYVILATIIMSIIPLIELKGAIPFGVSEALWGENALTVWQAYFCSILGGLVITIILSFIFEPLYKLFKDKKFFKSIINFFTDSVNKKAENFKEENKVNNGKNSLIKKLLITFVFVSLPIPGTGVYTGTALAILLGLSPLQSILSVTLGNIVAGIIITTICAIFPAFTHILLYIFVTLIVVYLVYRLIVHTINKKQLENKDLK